MGFLVNALLEMSLLCKWAVAIYPVLKIDKEIRQDYVFTLTGYFFLDASLVIILILLVEDGALELLRGR